MAVKPKNVNLSNTSVDILNAIRNSASQYYRDYIPVAANNAESVKEIGNIMLQYAPLQNEFIDALVNRIGLVIATSKQFYNKLALFKKGYLELGETVEEIFVEIAEAQEFDVEIAEKELYKRVIPDVRAAFHTMNYQKFYKVTVSRQQLKQAFLSWSGVSDLITKITESMFSGANYDEFLVTKYLLAKRILQGFVKPIEIPEVNAGNMKQIASIIKGVSNVLEFPSTEYNIMGVHQQTDKNEQYLLVNAKFDALMDVEVLASAFNMNKAEFLGHRILVDTFDITDEDRLNNLLKDNAGFKPLTEDEKSMLDNIPAVLVDRNFFMLFDNLTEMEEAKNGQGLYWNYFYHVWKTFSTSPFSNCAVFVQGKPAVNSVAITPQTADVKIGDTIQLTAEVDTNYFASKAVTWSSNESLVTVSSSGLVTIGGAAQLNEEVTITATSVFDKLKSGTSTLTIKE